MSKSRRDRSPSGSLVRMTAEQPWESGTGESRASQLSVCVLDARRAAFFVCTPACSTAASNVFQQTRTGTGRLAPFRFYANISRNFKTRRWVAPMEFVRVGFSCSYSYSCSCSCSCSCSYSCSCSCSYSYSYSYSYSTASSVAGSECFFDYDDEHRPLQRTEHEHENAGRGKNRGHPPVV